VLSGIVNLFAESKLLVPGEQLVLISLMGKILLEVGFANLHLHLYAVPGFADRKEVGLPGKNEGVQQPVLVISKEGFYSPMYFACCHKTLILIFHILEHEKL
jgi:hypothetical protein